MSAGNGGVGGCPEAVRLEALSRGEHDIQAERHVKSCPQCTRYLDEAKRNAAFIDEIVGSLRGSDVLVPGVEPRTWAAARGIEEIGGYRIIREIGRGGQGVVYEGLQLETKRSVAIKMLLLGRSGERQRLRFEREAEIVASLRHPGIVTVLDSVHLPDGRQAIVMEFVEGLRLDRWAARLRDEGPITRESARRFLELGASVCDAVEYAHRNGVIHRDIKPGNILVEDGDQARVLDFGLARRGERSEDALRTKTGAFEGTPAYSSPEQVSGDPDLVDTRTDVYTLGVLLYELLTGMLPYATAGALVDVVRNITESPPIRPEKIDDELWTILVKAMAKEPERRYQAAGELREDLLRYLAGDAINAKRDSTWYVLKKTTSKHRFKVASAAIVLVAGAAMLVYMWRQAIELSVEKTKVEKSNLDLSASNLKLTENQAKLEAALARAERSTALMGDAGLAEKQWYERSMTHGAGVDFAAAAFGGAPAERATLWALAELEARQPCLGSIRLGVGINAVVQVQWDDEDQRFWAIDQSSGQIWRLSTGETVQAEPLQRIEISAQDRAVFSGFGTKVIASCRGERVRVWRRSPGIGGFFAEDSAAGKEIGSAPLKPTRVWAVAEGGVLAMYPSGSIVIDPADGPPKELQPGHRHKGPFGMAVSRDGERVWVLSGDESRLEEIDVVTCEVVRSLQLPEFPGIASTATVAGGSFSYTLSLNEEGWQLSIVCDVRAACLDLRDATPRWVNIESKAGYIHGLEPSANGRIAVAISTFAGQVHIINMETGLVLREIAGHLGPVGSKRLSSDGRMLATADNAGLVRLWNVNDGVWNVHLSGPSVATVSTLFVGSNLLLVGDNSGLVRAWDWPFALNPGRSVYQFEDSTQAIAVSSDGKMLGLAGDGARIAMARIGERGSLEDVRSFPTSVKKMTGTAFSPDGKFLACAGHASPVTIWDTSTGALVASIRGSAVGQERAPFVAFSPDGKWLVWAENRLVYVRDMESGKIVQILGEHLAQVRTGRFSPDGTILATGSDDRAICLWDTATWKVRQRLTGAKERLVSLAFHPNGKVLFSGEFSPAVRAWDVDSGQELAVFQTGSSITFGLEFSPDGRKLAVATQTNGAQLWDFDAIFRMVRNSREAVVSAFESNTGSGSKR